MSYYSFRVDNDIRDISKANNESSFSKFSPNGNFGAVSLICGIKSN